MHNGEWANIQSVVPNKNVKTHVRIPPFWEAPRVKSYVAPPDEAPPDETSDEHGGDEEEGDSGYRATDSDIPY